MKINNWKTCKLDEICNLIAGFAFKGKDFGLYHNKVIKITNIEPPFVNMATLSGIDLSKYNKEKLEKFIAKEGDYVLAMTGATIGKLGRICSGKAYINQRVLMFKPTKEIDKKFLYYVLASYGFSQYVLNHIDSDSAQANISATTLGKFSFALPSLDIQRKIAAVLGALDDKIELNNKINNNLEQQAQALILEFIKKSNKKVPLAELISFTNGFAFKSSDYLPEGKYKVITIKNVQDGKVSSQGASCLNMLPSKLSPECLLVKGDVLLSLTGNVGRVGIVTEENLLLNQRVAKINSKDSNLLPFIYFYMRLPEMKLEMENISKGTAQQNLSPVETLKLEIAFEKEGICFLSSILKSFFDHIIYNTTNSQILETLRDSLLPKLMSGEIDVSKVKINEILDDSLTDKLSFTGEK